MDQTSRQTETQVSQSDSQVGKRIVTVLFGLAEVILAFRFLFKLFAANAGNGFVKGLYAITQPVVGIFEGIFGKPSVEGSVLEPATLIVMAIVGLLAWGILKLMSSKSSNRVEKTSTAPHQEPKV